MFSVWRNVAKPASAEVDFFSSIHAPNLLIQYMTIVRYDVNI